MIRTEMRVCHRCDSLYTSRRDSINHGLHIALTILTGGAWAIVYLAVAVNDCAPWSKCPRCQSTFPEEK